jgi:drug/metabolite transporter (DMT)-like permease
MIITNEVNKLWGIVVGLCGVFFFALGIRHNKKIHKEEGTGTGILSESIILALIVEGFFWIFDKLPYWVAKTFYFLLALVLLTWSYKILT